MSGYSEVIEISCNYYVDIMFPDIIQPQHNVPIRPTLEGMKYRGVGGGPARGANINVMHTHAACQGRTQDSVPYLVCGGVCCGTHSGGHVVPAIPRTLPRGAPPPTSAFFAAWDLPWWCGRSNHCHFLQRFWKIYQPLNRFKTCQCGYQYKKQNDSEPIVFFMLGVIA